MWDHKKKSREMKLVLCQGIQEASEHVLQFSGPHKACSTWSKVQCLLIDFSQKSRRSKPIPLKRCKNENKAVS